MKKDRKKQKKQTEIFRQVLSKGETDIDRETKNQSGCETEILRNVETEKQSNWKDIETYTLEQGSQTQTGSRATLGVV